MVMTGCLASTVVNGAPWQVALGVVLVLACGAAAGALNGAIVVFGRLQPIIVTLATGAVYFGFALLLRPAPGGEVSEGLADALTGRLFGVIPSTLVLLAALLVLGWMPFRRTVTGRACYAVGSSEQAAYLSGVPSERAKFLAYTIAGLLSGVAGLLLSLIALSGEASGPRGGAVHPQFHRGGGDRRHLAVWRHRRDGRLHPRRLRCCAPSATCSSSSTRRRSGSRCSRA